MKNRSKNKNATKGISSKKKGTLKKIEGNELLEKVGSQSNSLAIVLPQILYKKRILSEDNKTPLSGVQEILFERIAVGIDRSEIKCQITGFFSKPQAQDNQAATNEPTTLSLFSYLRAIASSGIFPAISVNLMRLLWNDNATEEVIKNAADSILTEITGMFPDGRSGFIREGPPAGFPHFNGDLNEIRRFTKFIKASQLIVAYYGYCYAAFPMIRKALLEDLAKQLLTIHSSEMLSVVENMATLWWHNYEKKDTFGTEQVGSLILQVTDKSKVFPIYDFELRPVEALSKHLFREQRIEYLGYLIKEAKQFLALNPKEEIKEGADQFIIGPNKMTIGDHQRKYERQRQNVQQLISWCEIEIIDIQNKAEVNKPVEHPILESLQAIAKAIYATPTGKAIVDGMETLMKIDSANFQIKGIKDQVLQKSTSIEKLSLIETHIKLLEDRPKDEGYELLSSFLKMEKVYTHMQIKNEQKYLQAPISKPTGNFILNDIEYLHEESFVSVKDFLNKYSENREGKLYWHTQKSGKKNAVFIFSSLQNKGAIAEDTPVSGFVDNIVFLDKDGTSSNMNTNNWSSMKSKLFSPAPYTHASSITKDFIESLDLGKK